MFKQIEISSEQLIERLKYVTGNTSVQDEKDCHEMAKIKDDLEHLEIAYRKAKRTKNYSYLDVIRGEIKSREKRLEKLRRF